VEAVVEDEEVAVDAIKEPKTIQKPKKAQINAATDAEVLHLRNKTKTNATTGERQRINNNFCLTID
jgi:hypothetical protein